MFSASFGCHATTTQISPRDQFRRRHRLAGCLLVLVVTADFSSPVEYAAVRKGIDALCRWILMPSLALVLISGLLAIVATRSYIDARWAWVKALLGLSMFEGTLGVVITHAKRGADLSAKVAGGDASPEVLAQVLRSEWIGLWTIMAIAMANVVLGIWRPRLKRRPPRTKTVRSDSAQESASPGP
jgi:hypothetical protein